MNNLTLENDYKYIKVGDASIVEKKGEVVIYSEIITGASQFANYIWVILLFFFGLCFCTVGLSSYFDNNLSFLASAKLSSIEFIPQGILLLFYGTSALLLSFLFLALIKWNIGSGTNIYDVESKVVRITRQGFPNLSKDFILRQQNIYLVYPFSEILNIELEIQDGITPTRIIFLILKDGRRIPLTPSNKLDDILAIETRSIFIAKLLKIDLKLNGNKS
jgi:hypothetical protein